MTQQETSALSRTLDLTLLCDGPITHPEDSYQLRCVLSVIAELNSEDASAYYDCPSMKKQTNKQTNNAVLGVIIFQKLFSNRS
jgi:hypothetical protein